MKTCPTCKVERPEDQFHKNKKRKDGLASWCKPCSKEWRDKNKHILKKHSISQKKKTQSQKATLIEYKGGACMDCGYTSKYVTVFDFHHRDPTQKKFEVGAKLRDGMSQTLLDEADKCDLLCANCHRIRHEIEG